MMFDTFDRTGEAEFPFPKPVVFKALTEALRTVGGMRSEAIDAMASRLEVSTGVSAFSWGERVSISVSSNGDQASKVHVQSGAKTIFGSAGTHGKNRKNVRKILEATSRILATEGNRWLSEIGTLNLPVAAASLPDQLEHLISLHKRGLINEIEFEAAKSKLLAR